MDYLDSPQLFISGDVVRGMIKGEADWGNHFLQIKGELTHGVMDVPGKEQAGFDLGEMENILSS